MCTCVQLITQVRPAYQAEPDLHCRITRTSPFHCDPNRLTCEEKTKMMHWRQDFQVGYAISVDSCIPCMVSRLSLASFNEARETNLCGRLHCSPVSHAVHLAVQDATINFVHLMQLQWEEGFRCPNGAHDVTADAIRLRPFWHIRHGQIGLEALTDRPSEALC